MEEFTDVRDNLTIVVNYGRAICAIRVDLCTLDVTTSKLKGKL